MLLTRFRFALLSLPLALAVAALASPGCSTAAGNTGGAATGSAAGTGGAGGASVGCPPDVPQGGDACQITGACRYPEECCGDTTATCTSGHWKVSMGVCVGKTPAEPCPTDAPTPGTPCALACTHPACPYGSCPGASGPAFTAQCIDATWFLAASCDAGAGGH